MLVDTYCRSQEVKIIYWMRNHHQTCTVRILNTFIHSYNCWSPYGLQSWNVVEHNMKIINPISKHSKQNQACFFHLGGWTHSQEQLRLSYKAWNWMQGVTFVSLSSQNWEIWTQTDLSTLYIQVSWMECRTKS